MEVTLQVSDDQVAEYLQKNPQFFERHPMLLADMYLPSPHGIGTVSLAERQQLAQRDKIRVLESRMAELLSYGKENDTISEKVHRLSLGLLAAQDFDILLQLLVHSLREDFQVPHVAVRLWATPQQLIHAAHDAYQQVDAELSQWTQNLLTPYCGKQPELDLGTWFGAEATPQSYALIALRSEHAFGLLVLASDDANRFYPEMGTLFLKRIGELVSAALLRHVTLS
jgi:uncharacterized protein